MGFNAWNKSTHAMSSAIQGSRSYQYAIKRGGARRSTLTIAALSPACRSLWQMRGKQEYTKHGSSTGTTAIWQLLLLPPLLVLIVLKTGFLPQVTRCKSPFTCLSLDEDQFHGSARDHFRFGFYVLFLDVFLFVHET